ncbi:MAG: helix-turn-helix domain-containing protein [Devosia sp.]|nr:helix-turn-helix domain-containing protein [Devosia sp.]
MLVAYRPRHQAEQIRQGPIRAGEVGLGGEQAQPQTVRSGYRTSASATAAEEKGGRQTQDQGRPPPDAPYTPQTLAEHWGVSDNHVRSLIRRGELESVKPGGRLTRISKKAVAAYESRNEIPK